jgi:hypothetical protein
MVSVRSLAVLLIWILENLFASPVALTEGADVSGLFLRDFSQTQRQSVTRIVKCPMNEEQYLTN